jgi:hypothetical protein
MYFAPRRYHCASLFQHDISKSLDTSGRPQTAGLNILCCNIPSQRGSLHTSHLSCYQKSNSVILLFKQTDWGGASNSVSLHINKCQQFMKKHKYIKYTYLFQQPLLYNIKCNVLLMWETEMCNKQDWDSKELTVADVVWLTALVSAPCGTS